MMSLNISGSTEVIVTLKSLAKTASGIRDAKHRALTSPNTIPNGFSRAAFRLSTIPQSSDRASRHDDGTAENSVDVKLKFLLRKCKREIDVTALSYM